MPTPTKEPLGAPQDEPEGILGRWHASYVLAVVAIGLALVTCSAFGLGMFILIDRWVQSCSLSPGGIL